MRAKEAAQQRLIQIEAERREIKASLRLLESALKSLDPLPTDRVPDGGDTEDVEKPAGNR